MVDRSSKTSDNETKNNVWVSIEISEGQHGKIIQYGEVREEQVKYPKLWEHEKEGK